MEQREWARWTPLLGVVFVVVLAVRFFALSGDTPDADDPGVKVIEYYKDNEAKEIIGSIVGVVAAVFLVFFAAHLRRVVRVAEVGRGYLSAVLFGGALILAAGASAAESIHFALADKGDELQPAASQALNALDQNFFFPIVLGFGLLLLSTGLSIIRFGVLPKWIGWIAVVLFVAAFTPAGFFAFLLGLLWFLVVSVLLYARQPGPAARMSGPATPD